MKVAVVISVCLAMAYGQLTETVLNELSSEAHLDCDSLMKAGYKVNGTYRLEINGEKVLAPCEFGIAGALSIIIFRRDNVVNWDREFESYEKGFTVQNHDYFIGLSNLHHLTKQMPYTLKTELWDWNNGYTYSMVKGFYVTSKDNGYILMMVGQSYGEIQADIRFNNDQKFYARGKEDPRGCVNYYGVGWWYNQHDKEGCTLALPTGHYYSQHYSKTAKHDGIFWKSYRGKNYSLKYLRMSIMK